MKTIVIRLVLGASQLTAGPLVVPNGSFEVATLPINFGYALANQLVPGTNPNGGTLADWTALNLTPGNYIGAYDQQFFGHPNWSFAWEDGNNGAYVQALGIGAINAGLSQILPYILTADTTYTVGATVGRRIFTLPVWNYSIELWAGGVQLVSASNLALASLPGFVLPGDISASDRYYHRDITHERFVLNDDSTITVPNGPGLGVTMNEAALKEFTLATESLVIARSER